MTISSTRFLATFISASAGFAMVLPANAEKDEPGNFYPTTQEGINIRGQFIDDFANGSASRSRFHPGTSSKDFRIKLRSAGDPLVYAYRFTATLDIWNDATRAIAVMAVNYSIEDDRVSRRLREGVASLSRPLLINPGFWKTVTVSDSGTTSIDFTEEEAQSYATSSFAVNASNSVPLTEILTKAVEEDVNSDDHVNIGFHGIEEGEVGSDEEVVRFCDAVLNLKQEDFDTIGDLEHRLRSFRDMPFFGDANTKVRSLDAPEKRVEFVLELLKFLPSSKSELLGGLADRIRRQLGYDGLLELYGRRIYDKDFLDRFYLSSYQMAARKMFVQLRSEIETAEIALDDLDSAAQSLSWGEVDGARAPLLRVKKLKEKLPDSLVSHFDELQVRFNSILAEAKASEAARKLEETANQAVAREQAELARLTAKSRAHPLVLSPQYRFSGLGALRIGGRFRPPAYAVKEQYGSGHRYQLGCNLSSEKKDLPLTVLTNKKGIIYEINLEWPSTSKSYLKFNQVVAFCRPEAMLLKDHGNPFSWRDDTRRLAFKNGDQFCQVLTSNEDRVLRIDWGNPKLR